MLQDGTLERTAAQLPPHERRCTCCDKKLTGALIWLEYDQRIWAFHDFGGVPEDKSQGMFVFGPTCAKNESARARALLNEWRFS